MRRRFFAGALPIVYAPEPNSLQMHHFDTLLCIFMTSVIPIVDHILDESIVIESTENMSHFSTVDRIFIDIQLCGRSDHV